MGAICSKPDTVEDQAGGATRSLSSEQEPLLRSSAANGNSGSGDYGSVSAGDSANAADGDTSVTIPVAESGDTGAYGDRDQEDIDADIAEQDAITARLEATSRDDRVGLHARDYTILVTDTFRDSLDMTKSLEHSRPNRPRQNMFQQQFFMPQQQQHGSGYSGFGGLYQQQQQQQQPVQRPFLPPGFVAHKHAQQMGLLDAQIREQRKLEFERKLAEDARNRPVEEQSAAGTAAVDTEAAGSSSKKSGKERKSGKGSKQAPTATAAATATAQEQPEQSPSASKDDKSISSKRSKPRREKKTVARLETLPEASVSASAATSTNARGMSPKADSSFTVTQPTTTSTRFSLQPPPPPPPPEVAGTPDVDLLKDLMEAFGEQPQPAQPRPAASSAEPPSNGQLPPIGATGSSSPTTTTSNLLKPPSKSHSGGGNTSSREGGNNSGSDVRRHKKGHKKSRSRGGSDREAVLSRGDAATYSSAAAFSTDADTDVDTNATKSSRRYPVEHEQRAQTVPINSPTISKP
ncbi:hypothetical protein GQ42DRAFT_165303 [Ramicandelaber brevisporus]|nr:hypothetical protein GQ42DRAFT_165303 [Ramicandelaber brevisporus]